MNLHDRVIYRCIHAACARSLPREVNFCPYCGTGQHAGVTNPAHVARPAQAEYREAAAATVTPELPATPVAPPPVLAKVAPPVAVVVSEPASVAQPAPPPPVSPPTSPPPPASKAPLRPGPASPPRREPVRLRWWLVALAALWLIWLYARPSPNKIADRIESATIANAECRLNDAQSELIALRMTKATPKQLSDLQKAIDKASATCKKKEARVTAWTQTIAAVDVALAAGDFGKAQAQLAQFTRRWNEDGETRKLKDKIAQQRAAAGPEVTERFERAAGDRFQSARNLIDEAERAIAAGDYRAASDKLETCVMMADEGNRECAAFKVHADRMLREQQRCLAAGRVWYQDACR